MALPQNGGANFAGNLTAATINCVQRYVALLTQASTTAPVATVLANELSGAIVWARSSTGIYTGTLTGAFLSAATGLSITPDAVGIISATVTSANVITLKTYLVDTDGAALADGALTGAMLQIHVFNM